jgi:hypothetical protein
MIKASINKKNGNQLNEILVTPKYEAMSVWGFKFSKPLYLFLNSINLSFAVKATNPFSFSIFDFRSCCKTLFPKSLISLFSIINLSNSLAFIEAISKFVKALK